LSNALKHLTVEAVKAIHREVLIAHGGAPGIRDQTLLESAVAAPQATMRTLSHRGVRQSMRESPRTKLLARRER